MGTIGFPCNYFFTFLNSRYFFIVHSWNNLAYAGCGKFQPMNMPITRINIVSSILLLLPAFDKDIYWGRIKKGKS